MSVTILVAAVLVGFALWRTWRPARSARWQARAWAGAPWDELILAIVAVVLTGGWHSPFVVVLAAPIAGAGLMSGLGQAAAMVAASATTIALAGLSGIGISYRASTSAVVGAHPGLSWSVELVLLAVIGAYSRRLANQASTQSLEANTHLVSQLEALSRANELLVELHQLDGAIPATVSATEIVDAALAKLTELAVPDTAMIVLGGSAPGTWTVAAAVGVEPSPVLADSDLPVPMRHCAGGDPAVRNRRGPSLSLRTRSAVYAPLTVGGRCLGLVALEWNLARDRHPEAKLVETVALQCAISLDNARMVAGLRSAGADDERHRIAERLHDDVGQDLAVLALTLDRVWTGLGREPALDYRDAVDELRQEARRILGHVRETLADLRTDVTAEHDLGAILESFLARVSARSHTSVALDAT
ncbi:MAG: histidine kinase, partial [Acidimicrobiales bacterium]